MKPEITLKTHLTQHTTGLLFLAYNMRTEYRERVTRDAIRSLAEHVLSSVQGEAHDISGADSTALLMFDNLCADIAACTKKDVLKIKVKCNPEHPPEMVGVVALFLFPAYDTLAFSKEHADAMRKIYARQEAKQAHEGQKFDTTTRTGEAYAQRTARLNGLREHNNIPGYGERASLAGQDRLDKAKLASPTNRLNAQAETLAQQAQQLTAMQSQLSALKALLKAVAVHTGLFPTTPTKMVIHNMSPHSD